MPQEPVVVVGGGLGGLATATYVARAGKAVVLYERAAQLGGRAQSRSRGEYRFNLGPHALYRGAHAATVLGELGVSVAGAPPSASGAYGVQGGRLQTLPTGFLSLLTTGLLRLPAKLELARLLGSIQRIDAEALQGESLARWLETSVRQPDTRGVLRALVRLATYANDPERLSAGVAIRQLQLALAQGVLYLHGGWQTLVDGLRAAAEAAGVEIVTGARVTGVEHDGGMRRVRLGDGTVRAASAVVIAGAPGDAAALVGGEGPLATWAAAAVPVRAACLDVALSRLPEPRATFALGIDRPLYLSVHSAVARLAPAGGATVVLAKYLRPGETTDPRADERELESLLDLVQPGWREGVVERHFLPSMVVANALVAAGGGGMAGRPGPAVPGMHGLYVVGDWVGPDGLLADATLASARRAAALIAGGGRAAAAAAA